MCISASQFGLLGGPRINKPSHYWGVFPPKDESPLKGDTPLLINQGFINPGLTLPSIFEGLQIPKPIGIQFSILPRLEKMQAATPGPPSETFSKKGQPFLLFEKNENVVFLVEIGGWFHLMSLWKVVDLCPMGPNC